jgi:hypothetical protein
MVKREPYPRSYKMTNEKNSNYTIAMNSNLCLMTHKYR